MSYSKNFLATCVIILTSICLLQASEDRPNIVWISCEDMSPYLGCYGDEYASTPNLDRFAKTAIRYTNAWSTMPICAPARSTLITGCYATSLGSMNLRSIVPQSNKVQPLPVLLRKAGYFCTNNVKTDYNFSYNGIWDECDREAHWRNREREDQPFFHVVNYTLTHEGHTQSMKQTGVNKSLGKHDPAKATLPVHFPEDPTIREIFAHHHDLISGLDVFFQSVLNELEADGLSEDTIVFFFSDHGSGFPRYKRWLYETGLKVPFMVHIPKKFKNLSTSTQGSVRDDLVGFVDFPATVLALAGIEIPETMQGNAFLGSEKSKGQPYLFGARDRADDVEDLSRCVRNDRFIYIRNYMPYRPYIRNARIFADDKGMITPLRANYSSSKPHPEVVRMFEPKAFEELYDLQNDPDELVNLAEKPEYASVKAALSNALKNWIINIRDAGFLAEGEMMRRSAHDSVYDMAQDPRRYDIEGVLSAAEIASRPDVSIKNLEKLSQSNDPAIRYWAANGLLGKLDKGKDSRSLLDKMLDDPNRNVSSVAAEALLSINPKHSKALQKLIDTIAATIEYEPTVALRASRALAEVGIAARPAIAEVKGFLKQIEGDVWNHYRNWYYPMFIGMSLDQVLINCGEGRDLRHN